MMFEWLEQEIVEIRTPRFHLIDGPAAFAVEDTWFHQSLAPLHSYRAFVSKFGNAKLYRQSRTGYNVGVFSAPRQTMLRDGTIAYCIGFHDDAYAYVNPVTDAPQSPVFVIEEGSERKVADGFDEWLTRSCAIARSSYGKEKWAEIVRGPEPFSFAEQRVIAARRCIYWRVVGFDENGDHVIELANRSDSTIPVLTIGARSTDGRLNGAIMLRIGHIDSGQTSLLHIGCYKAFRSPDQIELFELPEPQPEDRDYYEELRNLP